MSKPEKLNLETGMIAFARSLQLSEGLFFATKGEGDNRRCAPLPVLEKGVRGQSSEDNAKNPGLSNPQSVEYAVIPQGFDAVELRFNARVLPFAMKPYACGDIDVGASYQGLARNYARLGGMTVLASLYAWNIANARFAWRNRFQSDEMRVIVEFGGRAMTFDPQRLPLDEPASVEEMARAMVEGSAEDLEAFIGGIAGGLCDGSFAFKATWRAAMEPGQEIFPSQEYLREEVQKKDLSRVYAKMPTSFDGQVIQQASMHSQKIGAALRHIDIWHGNEDFGAVAVNPYAGVQETSDVLRAPKTKQSFYDLRKKAHVLFDALEVAEDASGIPGDVHFVMANLVRGGVFGHSSKKKDAA